MEKNGLLIVGDSFGTPTESCHPTWYEILGENHDVINLSQSGVGQYKIHQQLVLTNLDRVNIVLIISTSPYRLHATTNPFYHNHLTHSSCDLLYNDIKSRMPDDTAEKIIWWFHNMVDLDYCRFIHNLIVEESMRYCLKKGKKILVLNFLDPDFKNSFCLDLYPTWKRHSGDINHLNHTGHLIVAEKIQHWLLDNRDKSVKI